MTDEQEKQPVELPAIPPTEQTVAEQPAPAASWYSTHRIWMLWDFLLGFVGCNVITGIMFLGVMPEPSPMLYALSTFFLLVEVGVVVAAFIFHRSFIAWGIIAHFALWLLAFAACYFLVSRIFYH